MSKSNNKKSRKTRCDKFPLTLHKTGQYCKKIKGKIYYFGKDKKQALQNYLEKASELHLSITPISSVLKNNNTIKNICNIYLENQILRASTGQIQFRHVSDQKILLKDFVKFIGPTSLISDVKTLDIQGYINKLIKSKKSPNTINNRIAVIKAMYNWAMENEVISNCPNLKAIRKITKINSDKPVFSTEQVQKLLAKADAQMKAMIWLGLNCGFGCTDCGQLKWENIDLENPRIVYPRGKTGVMRNLILWPETVNALNVLHRKGELVFYTSKGNPWVRIITSIDKSGNEKYTKEDAVGKQFSKLMVKANLKKQKGTGFYTLRRTAATLAARSGDPFAVQKLLGHSDLKMATTYVQDISEQTDRVINNTRKLIIQGDS